MNMQAGSTIVGLIIIALCIVPFVLIALNKRRKENHLIESLNKLAAEAGLKISQYELWNENIIGLDESEAVVLALITTKSTTETHTIHLNQMSKCRQANISRTANTANSSTVIIDQLALVFTPKQKHQEEVSIQFYNTEYNSTVLTGELQVIEKWHRLLNERLEAIAGK